MAFTLRMARIKAALLAHASDPPADIVTKIMTYAMPCVEVLGEAFDAYLVEFLDMSMITRLCFSIAP